MGLPDVFRISFNKWIGLGIVFWMHKSADYGKTFCVDVNLLFLLIEIFPRKVKENKWF